MSQGGQGAQSCGVWVQPCCPEHLTASELQHGLLEMDRKAHILRTNSPTSNVDVWLGTVHISCLLSPQRVRIGWKLFQRALLTQLLLLMSIRMAPRGLSCHQSPPAHCPHLVSADCSRSTGYFSLVKEKKERRKSRLFVLQKGDEAQREAITCPKSCREPQTELGAVM